MSDWKVASRFSKDASFAGVRPVNFRMSDNVDCRFFLAPSSFGLAISLSMSRSAVPMSSVTVSLNATMLLIVLVITGSSVLIQVMAWTFTFTHALRKSEYHVGALIITGISAPEIVLV